MRRIPAKVRSNLDTRIRQTDFHFHQIDGEAYWDETAYYAFSLSQIEADLEFPTTELAALCREVAGEVVKSECLLKRLAIPEHAWDLILESWRRDDASLYGRCDFAYDGRSPAKLLEYNADTPTALFEAAVFQWLWLEDAVAQNLIPEASDQFNSIHECLIARLGEIRNSAASPDQMHFACVRGSIEDQGVISYLADCALQSGFKTSMLDIADIGTVGWGPFVDIKGTPIKMLFKLYPWEWMFSDEFSRSPSLHQTRFIEPPWKAVLSNKGILPLLWEAATGHPNLLPSYFGEDTTRHKLGSNYAIKPLYSREGENIVLVKEGTVIESTSGSYGKEGSIWQKLAPLPCFDGRYPVIGSWIVGDQACGLGIREDATPITRNTSRFLPHAILP